MQTNIENFYRSVAQNPALLNKITTEVSTPDEFIDRAVAVAKDEGYAIDRTEAKSWIDAQITAKSNGELSDVQLEAVAGGKGASAFVPNNNMHVVTNPEKWNNLGQAAYNDLDKGGRAIAGWFSSW